MTGAVHIRTFLAAQMADSETQWSLGTFGALAEFMRDAAEPVTFPDTETALAAVTGRGAIRIDPRAELRLIAFETTTRESWNHRVALCLPQEFCAMSRRAALTELGPDNDALRPQDRTAVLFDLGIEALQADVCVRVSDPEVAAKLRAQCGQPLLAPGNPAAAVILAASPHRVFVSRVGRIEVFQPIPDPHGKSPEGPHTHLLPDLLMRRRTHAATEPIPGGFVPCAHLFPAHPAKDQLGCSRPFDAARHDAFQQTLRAFGDPDLVALKERVLAAIAAGEDPSVVANTKNRFARANIRVTLRQLKAARDDLPSLAAWMTAHEPSDRAGSADIPHIHHQDTGTS